MNSALTKNSIDKLKKIKIGALTSNDVGEKISLETVDGMKVNGIIAGYLSKLVTGREELFIKLIDLDTILLIVPSETISENESRYMINSMRSCQQ